MKRLLLCLIATIVFFPAFSQRINITGFIVTRELSGDVNLWGPAAATAVAKSTNPQGGTSEVKLIVTVKRGGTPVCGNDANSAMNDYITTKTITARDIISALGNCMLNPGQYTLCLKYVNLEGKEMSDEVCREFTVAEPKKQPGSQLNPDSAPTVAGNPVTQGKPGTQAPKTYRGPQLMLPANNTQYKLADLKKPITLRWTPVTPMPPNNDVIYTLRIVELKGDQSPEVAFRTNQPILEKDLKAAQAIWQVPIDLQDGGKQFAWAVEAKNNAGDRWGERSEVWSYRSMGDDDISINIDSVIVGCCVNGKQNVFVTVKNNLNNTNTKVKKISIVNINGSSVSIDISSSLSPAIPFSFLPSGGSTNFIGNINCINTINTLIIKAECERIVSGVTLPDQDIEYDTLHCICTSCDSVTIKIPETPLTINNNTVSFSSTISALPKKVKQLKADLVYFSQKPENEDCLICNTESGTLGNFASSTLTAPGFTPTATLPYGREAVWTPSASVLLNGNISFNITLPPIVKCCKQKIRLCIRYIITFDDCTTCEKVVCYSSN